MNIQSLAEILREAAAIIHAVPLGGQPDNMRQPIVDELEGFASWVEQGCVNRAEYDELLSQLEAIGAGGVNGRLMPGAAPVSAEPVANTLGKIRVGRLPTMNQDEYPGLGGWWVQLRIGSDGEEVLARVYGDTPEQAHSRAAALAQQDVDKTDAEQPYPGHPRPSV